MPARLPDDEAERLAALRDHHILDTPPEEEFDDLVRLAAQVCGVPIAAVSLIDEHRQWFKSIVGLPVTETSRDAAFCAHTILQSDVMVVPDALADQRFQDNPLVTDSPNIRFYAGAPLVSEDGYALGSLCVIDREPRQLTADQVGTLRLLARQVTSQLKAVRRVAERERLVAEKEQLAAERERSEADRLRLAAIIETCEDAVYGKNLDGMITNWNAGAERLYGYDASEVIGQNVTLLVPPDCGGEVMYIMAAVRRGERVAPLETVRLTKAGVRVDVSLRVSPITDTSGRVVGASIIARDISERKRAESTLEAERVFTRALLESLQEGIVACDAQGTLTLFNRAAREFHGLPEQPLPPELWAEHFGLFHADCLTPMRTRDIPLYRALQGEIVRDAEMIIAPKFGQSRTILASGRPILGVHGERLGAVAAMHDVTERKQIERELSRLAGIVASSQEAMMSSTLDGSIVSWNRGAERLYGYAASEVIGRNAAFLAGPNQKSSVPAVNARLIRGEAVEPIEVIRMRRDGTVFDALLTFSPILDERGAVVGQSCVACDITARKEAERALVRSQARLVEAQRIGGIGDFDLDVATGRITWSAELFRLLEFDPALGEPSLDAVRARILPEDWAIRDRLFAHALETGEPYSCDIRLQLPSGTPRCLHLVGKAAPNADGTMTRIKGVMLDVTERKTLEAELLDRAERLRQGEARTTAILESIGDAFFSLDSQWRFTYTNRQAERVLLRTQEQLLGRVIWDVFPEAVGSDFHRQYMRAIAEGVTVTFEAYYPPLAAWSAVSAYPTQDGSLSVFFQDVTERKALEAELQDRAERLRESEAGLRALLDGAPVILYATDADGKVTLSEGTGLSALGLRPGEVVGRSVFEFSGGDAEIEAKTRRALAGETVSYDARIGGLSLHTELRPLLNADDSHGGLIGVCFDVTERVLSEERFRALFERSSHAHLLFDEVGGIIDCNAAALVMMRCADKEQLLGMHPALLSPEFQPDGRPSGEKGAEMCALARRNGGHRFEWIRRAADGYEYPVEVTLTPVTLAGSPVLLSVWHDLTERKRAEELIRDHAVILEYQKGELEKANAELAALATTDGLTGLKNHRAFQERLSDEVSRAARYATPLSLILLDVDHFKQFNDAYGHPAGDAVLRSVARVLQDGARDTDIVARYGGEEFVLILPQTDTSGAVALAERLREALERHSWPVRAVTASFGVATLRLAEESGTELLARADAGTYQSKAEGRNRVTFGKVSAPERWTP